MFNFIKGQRSGGTASLVTDYQGGGLCFSASGPAPSEALEWLVRPEVFSSWEKAAYLAQLHQEDLAVCDGVDLILPWPSVYWILDSEDHASSVHLLDLPTYVEVVPTLEAAGSPSDSNFDLALGWHGVSSAKRVGGILKIGSQSHLLPASVWELAEGIRSFARREDRSRAANEREFGRLRKLALRAGARLDNYVEKTVVLTLERLSLGMTQVELSGTPVVELLPRAEGAPDEAWLRAFDSYSQVQEHYDIPGGDGRMLRVIPDDAVKEVLAEIKRMPGRRVGGSRARKFLRNPYAVLGEAVVRVLPPEAFEASRKAAGIYFQAFSIAAQRLVTGQLDHVAITIIPEDEEAEAPVVQLVDQKEDLAALTKALGQALRKSEPSFTWRGNELDLRGDAAEQLTLLRHLLEEKWVSDHTLINMDDIFDLARYAERIIGIDVYKPVYSPHIQKDQDGPSWTPDLEAMISWQPPGEAVPVTRKMDPAELEALANKVCEAENSGKSSIVMPDWPAPIAIEDARQIVAAFAPPEPVKPLGCAEAATSFDVEPKKKVAPIGLLMAENIEASDYVEERGRLLAFPDDQLPQLPASLRPDVTLKPHQNVGVAWLQHLWGLSSHVRGCIFADDMGLGKTLQMLAFIHWVIERDPDGPPALVVAPVSLLDNWRNEIARFFQDGASRTLMLYGRELNKARVRREAIDEDLVAKGLTKFLRPDWLGDAQIVLTTYETLRDLEISFAAVRWGIMVCDEAQKIKSPNALVTRAAKKQNVRFRIACTGTPVENTLADLWCLFDFVQPGLLGPLNEFSKRYRRPIEASTDEQKAAVDELRRLIEPQVLRRMKRDVANLKPKVEDGPCRSLGISSRQLNLYSAAIGQMNEKKQAAEEDSPSAAGVVMLSMLHRLRMICADPHEPGFKNTGEQPLKDYRRHSRKMHWLMEQLEIIRQKGEKVIVFTEYRDIQRLVQRYVSQTFGIPVSVVNGDTKATSDKDSRSRQNIIDAFQARPGFGVIVLSTTAVGFGVNIQAANHVIHFTRPWNPAKEDQATDRAYRIGQTREVTVYYPTITSPDFVTFEEKLDRLLAVKRGLADDMLNGADDISMAEWDGLDAPDGSNVMMSRRVTSSMLATIDGKTFEKLCQVLWSKRGWSTYCTPASGDGGVDVVAIDGGKGLLIQCKTSSQSGKLLGWDGVKEVAAGAAAYRSKHPSVSFELVVAANVGFNDSARQQADVNHVRLIAGAEIGSLLDREVQVTVVELA